MSRLEEIRRIGCAADPDDGLTEGGYNSMRVARVVVLAALVWAGVAKAENGDLSAALGSGVGLRYGGYGLSTTLTVERTLGGFAGIGLTGEQEIGWSSGILVQTPLYSDRVSAHLVCFYGTIAKLYSCDGSGCDFTGLLKGHGIGSGANVRLSGRWSVAVDLWVALSDLPGDNSRSTSALLGSLGVQCEVW